LATASLVLQAEQGGEFAEGVVEQRGRVVQGEVQVAEDLQAHHAVQAHPATQEDEHRPGGQVGA
jgi:hypothetical protein